MVTGEWNPAEKTCLITGATSGHGRAIAAALSGMGADVILLGRSREKCSRVQEYIRLLTGKKPDILVCDLSSLSDVRRAAAEFLARERPLHILVNNAGQVNPKYQTTEDGFEQTFAVNYLSMFLLTGLLLDRIKESAPARIINISSDVHRIAELDLDDLQGRNRKYSFMGAYARSKLAVVYFTRKLDERLAGTGVTANAVHPGAIASNIADKPGALPRLANFVIHLTLPKPERAARTAVYCAVSPELDGMGGGYYSNMKRKEPKVSTDPGFGTRVWEITEQLVGL